MIVKQGEQLVTFLSTTCNVSFAMRCKLVDIGGRRLPSSARDEGCLP